MTGRQAGREGGRGEGCSETDEELLTLRTLSDDLHAKLNGVSSVSARQSKISTSHHRLQVGRKLVPAPGGLGGLHHYDVMCVCVG